MALACAFATNLGFLYKYRGARDAASVDIRHPVRSAGSLFGSKWFAIGMLVATGAWVFHVAALALAPMSVVQVVLSGGVVLLAVMAERLFGLDVGPRQWAGVAFTALGLVLLAVTLPATGGSHSQFSLTGMIAFEGALVGAGGPLIMGPRPRPGARRGPGAGVAAVQSAAASLQQHARYQRRVVGERHVPAPGQADVPRLGQPGPGAFALAWREQAIVRPPGDRHRHVERLDPLVGGDQRVAHLRVEARGRGEVARGLEHVGGARPPGSRRDMGGQHGAPDGAGQQQRGGRGQGSGQRARGAHR